MIHFQLPRNSPFFYKYIECIFSDGNIPAHVVSNSLAGYLNDIKQRIDSQESEWDVSKRYTNPYEYIHTIVPGKKKSIAKHKPLSRSYFKMIEIVYFFKLMENMDDTNIQTYHLAEGPGGFIEAIVKIRNNTNDRYIGMSILDDKNDPNIPGWKKSRNFLQENPNVSIEHGIDGTGNILSSSNFEYCKNEYGNKMYLITGDGGFDFSVDFNNQEHQISRLLFGQIVYALVMQKKNGTFILKIFDIFNKTSVDIVYLLSYYYKTVYIVKPNSSRYANSEKYIVCKGYIGPDCEQIYKVLATEYEKMLVTEAPLFRIINIPLTLLFTTKIEEYNAIFGQQQIENIQYTLILIHNNNKEKYASLMKNNVKKCVDWCNKYGVLYNSFNITANVFMENSSS
jgi:23S rRNA U2552 (ribose-2'-O)-methylase RlmE/FtsJ